MFGRIFSKTTEQTTGQLLQKYELLRQIKGMSKVMCNSYITLQYLCHPKGMLCYVIYLLT